MTSYNDTRVLRAGQSNLLKPEECQLRLDVTSWTSRRTLNCHETTILVAINEAV